jgi:hypothetical protein
MFSNSFSAWHRGHPPSPIPPLHDHQEILCRIFDELDVRHWIAVHQQQVAERAFFYNPELPQKDSHKERVVTETFWKRFRKSSSWVG